MFTFNISSAALRHRSFLRMNRSRARTFRVILISNVRTMRLIGSTFRVVLLCTRSVIFSKGVRFPTNIPYLSNRIRVRVVTLMLSNVIRRIRSSVNRIRLVRVGIEVLYLRVKKSIAPILKRFRRRYLSGHKRRLVNVRLCQFRDSIVAIMRKRLRGLLRLRARTLNLIISSPYRISVRNLTLLSKLIIRRLNDRESKEGQHLGLVNRIISRIVLRLHRLFLRRCRVCHVGRDSGRSCNRNRDKCRRAKDLR